MPKTALLSDAQLIAALRGASPDGGFDEATAVSESLQARHLPAARALALLLVERPRLASRVAAEAFERAQSVVRAGAGPSEVFRPYLLMWVRRFADRLNEQALPAPPKGPVTLAYAELSEAEQLVLWHRGVEGEPDAVTAECAGLPPAFIEESYTHALDALRRHYADEYAASAAVECVATIPLLGVSRSPEEDAAVRLHRDSCTGCTRVDYELAAIGEALHRFLVPELLGVPSLEYLRQLSNPSERPEIVITPRRPRQRLYVAAAAGAVAVVGVIAALLARGSSTPPQATPARPAVLGSLQQATTTAPTRLPTTSAPVPTTVATLAPTSTNVVEESAPSTASTTRSSTTTATSTTAPSTTAPATTVPATTTTLPTTTTAVTTTTVATTTRPPTTTVYVPTADLATLTRIVGTATPGGSVVVVITVRNLGSDGAAGASAFVSVSGGTIASGGGCSAGGACAIGTLEPGGSRTFQLTIAVTGAAGSLLSVSVGATTSTADADGSNNGSGQSVTIG